MRPLQDETTGMEKKIGMRDQESQTVPVKVPLEQASQAKFMSPTIKSSDTRSEALEFFRALKILEVAEVTVMNDYRTQLAISVGLTVHTHPNSFDPPTDGKYNDLRKTDSWHCFWLDDPALIEAALTQAAGGTLFVLPVHSTPELPLDIEPFDYLLPPVGYHLLAKRRRIDVVIPIYNAPAYTEACIESVKRSDVRHPMLEVRYVVIDDASPDPRIKSLLAKIVPDCWLRIQNSANLGFVKTANLAFRLDPKADVVLLNSDTEVPSGWLARLAATAGMSDDIATVTPISNKASIYSWPGQQSGLGPVDTDVAQRAFSSKGSNLAPVEAPVGVGFCCYIRRSALEAAGGFDEIFGQGYGEETDFCLRARELGYKHMVEPRAYVLHEGGASMKEVLGPARRFETYAPNEDIVLKRHPQFKNLVDHYLRTKMKPLCNQLAIAYSKRRAMELRHILVICHTPIFQHNIGGVQLHAEETIRDLKDRFVFSSLASLSLMPRSLEGWEAIFDCNSSRLLLETHMLGTASGAEQFLASLGPDLIHIQHPFGLPPGLVEAAARLGIPMLLSLHDYALVCPKYNLVGQAGTYCGLPPLESDEHRLCLNISGLSLVDLYEWRKSSQRLLNSMSKTLFVSEDLKCRVQSLFQIGESEVVECGFALQKPVATRSNSKSSPKRGREKGLQICFLGSARADKGLDFICQLAPRLAKAGITVHFLGSDLREWPKLSTSSRKYKFHGPYAACEVTTNLLNLSLDVVCLLSPWPETFSRTLSEAWDAHIPVIVSPFGAPADRVLETGAGWVLPKYDVEICFNLIDRIAKNPDELRAKKTLVAKAASSTSAEISNVLGRLYESFDNRFQCPQISSTMPISDSEDHFKAMAEMNVSRGMTSHLGRFAQRFFKVMLSVEQFGAPRTHRWLRTIVRAKFRNLWRHRARLYTPNLDCN